MKLTFRKFGLALSLGVMTLGFAPSANAAALAYTWLGGTSGDWSTSANWSGNVAAPTKGTYVDPRITVGNTSGNPGAALIYSSAQGYTNYSTTQTRTLYIRNGEMRITGGTLEASGNCGNFDGMGDCAKDTIFTITDGEYRITRTNTFNGFNVHYRSTGNATVNIEGGTFAADSILFDYTASIAPSASGNAIVNLNNGGTLLTGSVNKVINATSTVVSTFNFNGGTFKVRVAGGTFGADGAHANLAYAYVKTGGAKIDTNSFDYTITQNLLAGTAGSGGLTKDGNGTLTITSAGNTYTGATTVNLGKLVVNGSIAASSGVSVAAGASLGGSGTVSVISGAGSVGP
ncbi:MAG: autotransporter-associated beta strand repeat-containing protein, partial [Thermoguttaceae bacterium]